MNSIPSERPAQERRTTGQAEREQAQKAPQCFSESASVQSAPQDASVATATTYPRPGRSASRRRMVQRLGRDDAPALNGRSRHFTRPWAA
jgi:hypothetical protein